MYSENSKTSDPKAQKKKKKKYYCEQAQKDSESILATSLNIIEASERARKDMARSIATIALKSDIMWEIISNPKKTY